MKFWMVYRYLKEGRQYLSISFVLSVFGVAIGVAALVVAMAVVSGYETTLRQSIIRLQGHLMLVKRGGVELESEIESTLSLVKNKAPQVLATTPFLVVEGLIVHNKKLSGVLLEGVEAKTISDVLSLSDTIIAGEFKVTEHDGVPGIVVGKGIATKYQIAPGDTVRLVIPISRIRTSAGFKPKVQKFYVHGVMNLGKTDFDERYILTDLKAAQIFGEHGSKISGWRMRLDDYEKASATGKLLEGELSAEYWTRAWSDTNRNLFQAVVYEKRIIFIIVLLMVVAASFNVASTLLLSVVRRYSQISILKAMGARKRFIRQLFTSQGLIIGALGSFFGIGLGLMLCRVFLWAEKKYGLFPGEVYKLDFVELEVRPMDLLQIVCISMFICYLATLLPARRGANFTPVEGLRYE